MKKKILILGVGAQGSTVAKRMNEEPNVEKIICADYDEKAVDSLAKELDKAVGIKVNAQNKDSIVDAAKGVDLIVNGLPHECHKNVLEAALEVKANYQDFNATDALHSDWIESIRILYNHYGPRFEAIKRTAVVATGSAPGLICAATRKAVRYLDTCDTINNLIYEGVETKRFLPFWWSPITALTDMEEKAYAVKDGELINTEPFGLPVTRYYDYMGLDHAVTLSEHCHDEPVHYWFNREKYFKGVKNVNFKYGGAGVEFAKPLYKAGLLSRKPERYHGAEMIPFDWVLDHIPPAPKYKEEIRQILMEGLVMDTGCMVIEAYGKKDGRDVLVEIHVFAPGLEESFQRSGLSAEMYLTGQGGALFTKMFVNDVFDQHGLISSDMLTYEQIDYYFESAKEFGIELQENIKEL